MKATDGVAAVVVTPSIVSGALVNIYMLNESQAGIKLESIIM